MTDRRLVFTVHGTPAGQGSKRHVGRGVMVESSKRVAPWREAVRAAAVAALPEDWTPIQGPVVLAVEVVFHRPRTHYRTGRKAFELRDDAPWLHATTPDADKLARAICDALGDAGVWHDDRQVAQLLLTKTYDSPENPFQGACIEIQAAGRP